MTKRLTIGAISPGYTGGSGGFRPVITTDGLETTGAGSVRDPSPPPPPTPGDAPTITNPYLQNYQMRMMYNVAPPGYTAEPPPPAAPQQPGFEITPDNQPWPMPPAPQVDPGAPSVDPGAPQAQPPIDPGQVVYPAPIYPTPAYPTPGAVAPAGYVQIFGRMIPKWWLWAAGGGLSAVLIGALVAGRRRRAAA